MTKPCESCEATRFPGAVVGILADGTYPPEGCTWVERCDQCELYPSDEDAAEVVARELGVEWGYARRATGERLAPRALANDTTRTGISVYIAATDIDTSRPEKGAPV